MRPGRTAPDQSVHSLRTHSSSCLSSSLGGDDFHHRATNRSTIVLPGSDVVEGERRITSGHDVVPEPRQASGSDAIRIGGREDRPIDQSQELRTGPTRSPCVSRPGVTRKIEGDHLPYLGLEAGGGIRMQDVHAIGDDATTTRPASHGDQETAEKDGGDERTWVSSIEHEGDIQATEEARRRPPDIQRPPHTGTVSDARLAPLVTWTVRRGLSELDRRTGRRPMIKRSDLPRGVRDAGSAASTSTLRNADTPERQRQPPEATRPKMGQAKNGTGDIFPYSENGTGDISSLSGRRNPPGVLTRPLR